MHPPLAAFAIALLSLSACACHEESAGEHDSLSREHTLSGQVLLPNGVGSRGVEIRVTIASDGRDPEVRWLRFDEDGHFTHTYQGRLTRLVVGSAIGSEVHRVDEDELPEALLPGGDIDRGLINFGVIDLRDLLTPHRIVLRAAAGQPPGVVRAGMFQGPPATGPKGGAVSLGSRQFPEITLGSEVEWLFARDARDLHVLVERPMDAARGTNWRSGVQQLFGPLDTAELPTELVLDGSPEVDRPGQPSGR